MLSMPMFVVHQACGLGIILEKQITDDVSRPAVRVTKVPSPASVAIGSDSLLHCTQDVISTSKFKLS